MCPCEAWNSPRNAAGHDTRIRQILLIAYGTARLIAASLVGVVGVAEAHHVCTTLMFGVYTPGVVSAVPFVVFGLMLLHAVASEYRRSRIRLAAVEPAYQTW